MRFEDWYNQMMEEDNCYLPYLFPGDKYANEDDEYVVVEREIYDEGRWSTYYRTIFKHRTFDEYWEVIFDTPSTEMQEGQDGIHSEPRKVVPAQKTITVYKYA